MKISNLLTDEVIMTELGARLARRRISLQLTQAALAEHAGVAKRTVERIEAGASAQLSSIIRLLRVLELLQELDQAIPDTGPGPMELLEHRGKPRRRVSRNRGPATDDQPWTWDEET